MKKPFFVALTLVTIFAPIVFHAQEPPIIDRKLFFGEIEIAGAQISPDGQYLSFLKPYKGTRNIWVKKSSEPFSAARPMSAEATRPIRSYFWSRDSKYILYSQDAGGDENFNVYAIDPTLAADPKTGVPPTRALTSLKGVRTEIFSAPKAKPDILYIGLNDRSGTTCMSCEFPPAKRSCCARTPSGSRDGTSITTAICAWRSGPARPAITRFCASIPTASS
jgi:hypothetical protein